MKKNNKKLGDFGEKTVLKYLNKKNFKIVSKNFRSKYGEIDVMFISGQYTVFAEVKTRSTLKYGFAVESVNLKKQLKILKTAHEYLGKNSENLNIRFDIIEVYVGYEGKSLYVKNINHIKNVILETGDFYKMDKTFIF